MLLIGSIGLVGLSLTAQSGGAVYTRAMSVGGGLGVGLYGLFSVSALLAPGRFDITNLAVTLLFLAGFYWAWRSFHGFREELAEVNRSGKFLAWFAVAIVLFAVYLSAFLLLS